MLPYNLEDQPQKLHTIKINFFLYRNTTTACATGINGEREGGQKREEHEKKCRSPTLLRPPSSIPVLWLPSSLPCLTPATHAKRTIFTIFIVYRLHTCDTVFVFKSMTRMAWLLVSATYNNCPSGLTHRPPGSSNCTLPPSDDDPGLPVPRYVSLVFFEGSMTLI